MKIWFDAFFALNLGPFLIEYENWYYQRWQLRDQPSKSQWVLSKVSSSNKLTHIWTNHKLIQFVQKDYLEELYNIMSTYHKLLWLWQMSFRSSAKVNKKACYKWVHVLILMSIYHIYSKMFPPRSCCSVDNPRQMFRPIGNIDRYDYTADKYTYRGKFPLPSNCYHSMQQKIQCSFGYRVPPTIWSLVSMYNWYVISLQSSSLNVSNWNSKNMSNFWTYDEFLTIFRTFCWP